MWSFARIFIADFYVLSFGFLEWICINQKSAVNANPDNHYVKYIIDNKMLMECVTISLDSGARHKLVIYDFSFIFIANLPEISRVYLFHLSLHIINFIMLSTDRIIGISSKFCVPDWIFNGILLFLLVKSW